MAPRSTLPIPTVNRKKAAKLKLAAFSFWATASSAIQASQLSP
jgi:hypothetical protein